MIQKYKSRGRKTSDQGMAGNRPVIQQKSHAVEKPLPAEKFSQEN
jgi:hypothetical protein